ncbi:MAG: competence protein TfoX [Ponticaulis sp.]|nr:competence protein TfoX [Ponticaulis sp.]
MTTTKETADYILEQIESAGDVTIRKMFGEYGVHCDGKFVALICDNTFFIKETEAGKAFAPDLDYGEPYPGAKPYPIVPGDLLEDRDWAAELVRITTAALPAPKPKKPKTPKIK